MNFTLILTHGLLINCISFFLIGILFSLTPCTYPMIPIISSIIMNNNKKSAYLLSCTYVLGVAFSYVLLGFMLSIIGIQFTYFFQQPLVVISFALLIILLGIYTLKIISLPALLPNANNKIIYLSNKLKGGTYIGVLGMGMLSVLIASPCITAPMGAIVAYLLTAGSSIIALGSLFCLGIGSGLPLIVLSATLSKFRPLAGTWMNWINYTIGSLMIIMGIIMIVKEVS